MVAFSVLIPGRLSGIAAIVLLFATGCSQPQHRVEPDTAQRVLEDVLKSWQQGDSPESWQTREPSVVVQDFDWKSGSKLVSFEILETEAVDANLHCKVQLTLSSDQGKKERTVTYLVGTSPVLTVFREFGM